MVAKLLNMIHLIDSSILFPHDEGDICSHLLLSSNSVYGPRLKTTIINP